MGGENLYSQPVETSRTSGCCQNSSNIPKSGGGCCMENTPNTSKCCSSESESLESRVQEVNQCPCPNYIVPDFELDVAREAFHDVIDQAIDDYFDRIKDLDGDTGYIPSDQMRLVISENMVIAFISSLRMLSFLSAEAQEDNS